MCAYAVTILTLQLNSTNDSHTLIHNKFHSQHPFNILEATISTIHAAHSYIHLSHT